MHAEMSVKERSCVLVTLESQELQLVVKWILELRNASVELKNVLAFFHWSNKSTVVCISSPGMRSKMLTSGM